MAQIFPARALLESPLITSRKSIDSITSSVFSVPSKSKPNHPLITSHQPTPHPLWRDIQVAPLCASQRAFCSAMSAVNMDPSVILAVSLYGESVPLTSWWSLPITTGQIFPSRIAWLNAFAISILHTASLYKILAWDPTTISFSAASSIRFILSTYCCLVSSDEFFKSFFVTSTARLSVNAKSSGLPEQQTHLKGQKP